MLSTIEDMAWDLREAAEDWCETRTAWAPRAVLLAYLLYAGGRSLLDAHYRSAFAGITFGLHEMGHLMFSWFGQWISVAGGTGLQLLAPALAAAHLGLKQGDYFGVSVCTCWLGFSFQEAAVYIADAQAQSLLLIGFSADPIHDWNYLLSSVGLLGWDGFFGGLALGTGALLWACGCGACAWICWRIAKRRGASGPVTGR